MKTRLKYSQKKYRKMNKIKMNFNLTRNARLPHIAISTKLPKVNVFLVGLLLLLNNEIWAAVPENIKRSRISFNYSTSFYRNYDHEDEYLNGRNKVLYRVIENKIWKYAQQQDWIPLPQIDSRKQKAENLIDISQSLIENGQLQQGIQITQQALNLAKEIADLRLQVRVLRQISQVYVIQGDFEKSLEIEKQRLLVAQQTKHTEIQASVLLDLSRAYLRTEQLERGISVSHQALEGEHLTFAAK